MVQGEVSLGLGRPVAGVRVPGVQGGVPAFRWSRGGGISRSMWPWGGDVPRSGWSRVWVGGVMDLQVGLEGFEIWVPLLERKYRDQVERGQ